MKILNKIRAIPIRLSLLTLLTLSLAGVALADGCSVAAVQCADGSAMVFCVSCGPSETPIASCFCDWSVAQGYFNCQSDLDCYLLDD